ncbi:hypothetical protein GQX74_012441 [Glossina fuscipes]|nr:hypothetical protein GQX74_012441 [Glossina fuscipes]
MAAGDKSTIGCAALKRTTKLKIGSNRDTVDNGQSNSNQVNAKPVDSSQNMRGGLRVYKIVILGDGGVGKSVEFTAMRDQYMRCGEGFIICYSVIDRHSYEEASEYRKLIQRVRFTEDIPLVLIANKSDLEALRKVSTEEGKNLANQFGCPFFETSAALRLYIDDVFYALVREIRRKEKERALGNGTSSEKLDSRRRSRWWRIRSIFALVFRRRRNLN